MTRPQETEPGADFALSDIKVADFTWAAAGPITTKTLADHGATVVRVESSVHLDSVRITGPFPEGKQGINTSGFYADFNCSKLGLALDLTHPKSLEIAKRLVEWADVVVESFTPGVMKRWGLDYESVSLWKPDVIMLSSSMQGQSGPYRNYSGYGGQGAALAGIHYLTGWPDLPPAGPKGAYTDAIAPRYSVAAILAALDYRDRTGLGQYIDLSQVEAAITGFLGTELLDFTVNGRIARPQGNRTRDSAPHGAFPCRGEDRWVTIAVESDLQWNALREVLGNPPWSGAPALANAAGRLAAQDEIEQQIAAWTSGQDPFELVARLQEAGVPSGVVVKALDLFEDPQLAHRRHFRELDHAEMGPYLYNGPASLLSETPAELRWGPPLLGEHTSQVLRELLGYADEEIEALVNEQVLR